MLIIRYQRTGRRNSPFYRIVLQNKRDAIGSKALRIFGSYNPHTKEAILKKDEILLYINNGAQVSNSIAKLFIANNIKHDRIVFKPSAEKASKKKGNETPKAAKVEEAVAETKESPAEKSEEAQEVKTEETQEEASTPEEPKAEESEPEAQAPEEKNQEENKKEN